MMSSALPRQSRSSPSMGDEVMTAFDESFPHRYEIECPTTLSGDGHVPQWYYPEGTQRGGSCGGGLTVKVLPPQMRPWFACFVRGIGSEEKILSTPDPDQFCAIASGEGCVVDAREPKKFYVLPGPIQRAIPLLEHSGILFATQTDVTLYGPGDTLWSSGRLCLDNLQIVGIDAGVVHACGFDGWREDARILVDIRSRRVIQTAFHFRP